MKGSRTRLRKVLPEREREEAAVPEAMERLISRGPTKPLLHPKETGREIAVLPRVGSPSCGSIALRLLHLWRIL
jgi:hypothetical protein